MKRLTDDQRDVAESAYRIAERFAGRWVRRHPKLRNEILSACGLAAVRAAARSQGERGDLCESYVRSCVKTAVTDALRREGPARSVGSGKTRRTVRWMLFSAISGQDGRALHRGEVRVSPRYKLSIMDDGWEAGFESVERRDEVRDALSVLSGRQKEVMLLLYEHGHTMKSAGDQIGITEATVDRLHRLAISSIREVRYSRAG